MSEQGHETVVPGTSVEVRAEGLIGVGSIATGNVGIVGTASRGPVNEVRTIGTYGEAVDLFGEYDSFLAPNVADHPLTLVRTLEQAFAGGASSVFAVRIADGDLDAATATVDNDNGDEAFTLTAVDEGSWGNGITVRVVDEGPAGSPDWTLTLEYRGTREVFRGADLAAVHAALAESTLVNVGDVENASAGFTTIDPAVPLAGGTDQPEVTSVNVAEGLAELVDERVNIVLVAGFGSSVVRGVVGAHLEQTENEGRERLAVLGVTESGSATDASAVIDEVSAIADDRIILCAPGIRAVDAASDADDPTVDLPASYLAAAVGGKLATLAPHVSLTNKTLNITDLQPHYNTTSVRNLLLNRMLVVRQKFGFQVVRGISTDPGPFVQISVRRIVDYAKTGVRLGSDPYIGRLNNSRVRGALKATLDGFLSQMVVDEMLTGYTLEVTATRAEEVNGIARVTMTLQPTFSIDFIRVTMNLQ